MFTSKQAGRQIDHSDEILHLHYRACARFKFKDWLWRARSIGSHKWKSFKKQSNARTFFFALSFSSCVVSFLLWAQLERHLFVENSWSNSELIEVVKVETLASGGGGEWPLVCVCVIILSKKKRENICQLHYTLHLQAPKWMNERTNDSQEQTKIELNWPSSLC